MRCTATAISHARSDEMHTLRAHVPRLLPACRRTGEVKHEIETPFTPCGQSRCVCSWLQSDSYACDGCSRLCCACGWGCASQTRTVAHAQVPPHAAGGSDAGTSIGAGVQCSCSWRCDERCVVGALRGQAAPASCFRVLSVRVRFLQLFKALHMHLRRCRPASARWPPVRVCVCVCMCVW